MNESRSDAHTDLGCEYGTALDLEKEIYQIPVIDAHEHLKGHEQCQACDGVVDFLTGTYLSSMLPFADCKLALKINDTALSDKERWDALQKIWLSVSCTGYGQIVRRMLCEWRLSSDLRNVSYTDIQSKLSARSPEMSRKSYAKSGIEHSLTHYLSHPLCGGISNVRSFLEGQLVFDERFHPLLGTLPFHDFCNKEDIESIELVSQKSISSLEELVNSIKYIIESCVAKGVVGLKDHAAYTRGLSFGKMDKNAANHQFQQLYSGETFSNGANQLSDYLFHKIIQISIELKIPVAIHTGYLVGSADPKSNVKHFVPIIEAYPDATFDLFHLNYPWQEDMISVLKRFPNTFANCCWSYIVDIEKTKQFLRSALGSIPATRILGFGGDYSILPEPVIAHLDIARTAISEVLSEAINKSLCSKNNALEIAKLWLYDNPRRIYNL